ncbi:MAG: hypothetical protein ACKVPX_10860 [Myxococcaceae bacterium]
MKTGVLVFAVCASACARASDANVDPSSLYTIAGEVRPASFAPRGTGALTVRIAPRAGSHVSPDSPLKISLSGQNVTLTKAELSRADVRPGTDGTTAFEVGVMAGATSGRVKANIVFFICTEILCARQVRDLEIPVPVN